MDQTMMNEYISNPTYYLKSFEFGGKYNVIKYHPVFDISEFVSRLVIKNGVLYDPKSYGYDYLSPAHGRYLYVLQNGELKFFNKGVEQDIIDKLPKNNSIFKRNPTEIYHSDLGENKNADYAGEIEFSKGIIVKVDNESGHYLPGKDGSSQVIQSIKNLGYSKEFSFIFSPNTK